MKKLYLPLVSLFVMAAILFMYKPAEATADFAENFQGYLSKEKPAPLAGMDSHSKWVKSFYEKRGYAPVWGDEGWFGGDKDSASLDDIQEALETSAYENGLDPKNYNLKSIDATYKSDAFKREWLLTNAVMDYMEDLSSGRVDPKKYDSMIFMQSENEYLDVHMANLLKDWSPLKYFRKIEPQQQEYKNLKTALAGYREIAKNGGWTTISNAKAVVYPGGYDPIIPEVRERLRDQSYDGVLPSGVWVDEGKIDGDSLKEAVKSAPEPDQTAADETRDPKLVYDAQLARKVAEFQYMNGKKTDAVIGPDTLNAMNITAEQRVQQLMMAMERYRWFPDNLGKKHIIVNIAGFYAKAVENNETAFTMPIIVGEVAHQTPVFSSVIKNVKMHPDWVATDSIARRYLIKKIQNNPSVISSLGYQLQYTGDGGAKTVPWENVTLASLDNLDLSQYRFRQKPGKYNALGLARFSIENDYSIFMHGTPSGGLFSEDSRTFSSGCIRVKDPLQMAKFLLKDESDYSESHIEDLYYLDDGEHPDTTYIDLSEDVPVYLTYSTAWVDDSGNVHFSDDVYGRDEKLRQVWN